MMEGYGIVITTCDAQEEATQLARGLVEAKLAACVQIEQINSWYRWEGSIENAAEYRLSIKTRRELFERIEEYLRKYHSYEVPEIVMTGIERVSRDYGRWIDENTQAE
jgi:periplasmic divalent cation tolerance protein